MDTSYWPAWFWYGFIIVVTAVAKYFIAVIIIGVAIFGLSLNRLERTRFFWYGLAVAGFSYVMASLAGLLYYNPRPFVAGGFTPFLAHAANNGFPSSHTLLAAALGALVLKFNHKLGIATLLAAAFIGLARVVAGVHHAIDVLASFAIVWLSAYLASCLARGWAYKVRGANRTPDPLIKK